VLFLDEVAELDLKVQAKLLRALEAREVVPLGASRPVVVDFGLVSATHESLRAQVAAGKLREDLFFRIARPEVRIPPLCERQEEIPWLVDAALGELEYALRRGSRGGAVALAKECPARGHVGHRRALPACHGRAAPPIQGAEDDPHAAGADLALDLEAIGDDRRPLHDAGGTMSWDAGGSKRRADRCQPTWKPAGASCDRAAAALGEE
jgi:hypothetical protein